MGHGHSRTFFSESSDHSAASRTQWWKLEWGEDKRLTFHNGTWDAGPITTPEDRFGYYDDVYHLTQVSGPEGGADGEYHLQCRELRRHPHARALLMAANPPPFHLTAADDQVLFSLTAVVDDSTITIREVVSQPAYSSALVEHVPSDLVLNSFETTCIT